MEDCRGVMLSAVDSSKGQLVRLSLVTAVKVGVSVNGSLRDRKRRAVQPLEVGCSCCYGAQHLYWAMLRAAKSVTLGPLRYDTIPSVSTAQP